MTLAADMQKDATIEYDGNGPATGRDIGHIREMVTALDENTERLIKALDGLSGVIEPILRPSDEGSPEDGLATPTPIRCALADDLARINDKLYRIVGRVQSKRDRVDI